MNHLEIENENLNKIENENYIEKQMNSQEE